MKVAFIVHQETAETAKWRTELLYLFMEKKVLFGTKMKILEKMDGMTGEQKEQYAKQVIEEIQSGKRKLDA